MLVSNPPTILPSSACVALALAPSATRLKGELLIPLVQVKRGKTYPSPARKRSAAEGGEKAKLERGYACWHQFNDCPFFQKGSSLLKITVNWCEALKFPRSTDRKMMFLCFCVFVFLSFCLLLLSVVNCSVKTRELWFWQWECRMRKRSARQAVAKQSGATARTTYRGCARLGLAYRQTPIGALAATKLAS